MIMPEIELSKSNSRRTLGEIARRGGWVIAWRLLAGWTPRFLNPWRIFLLRCFGARIGNHVLIHGSVWIDMPWNLEIGDYSAVGRRAWLYNFATIKIGSNTVVSQDTTVCTATHDYSHPHMPLISFPITIGNQAWIAANCFILPGVSIGDGVVAGARSLITRDLPAWTICAGHPCKPIKPRIQA
jgi:putative colanic acid biosynthesis acetyltransferase WcaF